MQGRKVVSWIMTAVMLMALLPIFAASAYAAGESPADTAPKITVVGSTIAAADGTEDNDFFELNLKIEPGSAGFSTAGVVLKYNRTVILPVDWSGRDIEVPVGDNWEEDKIAVIPAMGPAELSGKVALAQNPPADSAWGYLYLSAEAPLPVTDGKTIEKAVTVRFKYVDTTPVDPPSTASPAPTTAPTAEPTAEPVVTADEPAPDESPDPSATPAPADTQIPKSKADILKTFLKGDIVSVAPNLVAERSPAGKIVWYKADYTDTNEYFYEEPKAAAFALSGEPALSLTAPPDLGLVENGTSASTGGSGGGVDLGSVRTALCYDWDNTFLGAVTVAEGDSPDVAAANAAAVETFAKTLYKDADTKYTTDITTNEDRYVDDAAFPLTYKKSYNFSGWMETTAAALESTHSSFEDQDTIKAALKDLSTAPLVFTNGVTYLKAAYLGNEKLDNYAEGGNSSFGTRYYYTASNFSYSRVDAKNYSTKFTVRRKNADDFGVTRLNNPIVKVELDLNGSSVYLMTTMSGSDEQEVEIIVPKNADSYKYTIVDNSGDISYLLATPKSLITELFPSKEGNLANSGMGYVVEGTAVYVNQVAEEAIDLFTRDTPLTCPEWSNTINVNYIKDLNLYTEMQSQDSTLANNDLQKANTAKNKIMLYKVAKGGQSITWQDMNDAIKISTGSHLPQAATNANMKPKILAVQAKRTSLGRDLTVSELEAFIQNDFK